MIRKTNFDKKPTEEVEEIIDQLPFLRRVEVLPAEEAVGRFLANPCYAQISSPHYQASAMDGIAVRWDNVRGASAKTPKTLRLNENAWLVDTGDPLPDEANTVIKIEDVVWLSENEVEIYGSPGPGSYVRKIGEDIAAGEMILPAAHRITAVDVGGLLAGGVQEVNVWKAPVVRILPTGSELVEPGETVEPGNVIEYNSRILAALVNEWGGQALREPKVADDLAQLKACMVGAANEADLLVVIAGSSAGKDDYTAPALEELGELMVHGMAVKPGKPVIVGLINDTPVIGLPGYPVAALINAQLLVRRFIENYLGRSHQLAISQRAVIRRKLISPAGVTHFLRVKVGLVGDELVAIPLSRGAGAINTLVQADGLVRLPREKCLVEPGEDVMVEMFPTATDPHKHTLLLGAGAVALDKLTNYINVHCPGYELFTGQTGSEAGLLSLRAGEVSLAGVLAIEMENGEPDLTFLHKFLPGEEICAVNFTRRQVGLIFKKELRDKVNLSEYIPGSNLTFVKEKFVLETQNLIDFLIKKEEITPNLLNANWIEATSCLGVAAAVKAGIADIGFSAITAAKIYDLDCIPLAWERYIMVFYRRDLGTDGISRILLAMQDPELRREIDFLPGHDGELMGHMLFEGRLESCGKAIDTFK